MINKSIPPTAIQVPVNDAAAQPGIGRGQWMVLTAAFLGWMFDGLEMGLFPLIARPALQEMQHVAGVMDEQFVQTWMGRITALFLLGAAFGGLVFGWLGDRLGRVKAMTMSILAYSLFTGLGYFAQQPWHLGACRFVGALGMGGEWSLGVALVMECWPQSKRPLMAGIIGAAGNVGYALIAVIGIYFNITQSSWRWMMLVGATPAVLTLLIMFFVPESERWKASVQKEPSRPVREIFSHGLLGTTLLAIAFSSVALIVTWGIVQWIPLWVDQMTGGKLPKAKAIIALLCALGAIVGCLVAPLIGQRFGRRPVYFGLCLASLIVCSLLFRGLAQFNWLFCLMAVLVGACTAAFYGWLPQYLPELFPTRVRATGQGLAYNFGRILAALGAWQMGAVMGFFGKSYAKAGATIVLIYLVGMGLIWFAPETKGKPLPE